jgi:hypothetical protein
MYVHCTVCMYVSMFSFLFSLCLYVFILHASAFYLSTMHYFLSNFLQFCISNFMTLKIGNLTRAYLRPFLLQYAYNLASLAAADGMDTSISIPSPPPLLHGFAIEALPA